MSLSVIINENHQSRQLSRTSGESVCRQNFSILQADSLKNAEKALRKHPAPDDIDNFDFKKAVVTIDLDPEHFEKNNPQHNVIYATRTYTRKNREQTEDAIDWRFTMSTSTATITTSKGKYSAPGSYPFFDEDDYQPGGKLEGQPVGSGSPINVRKVNGKTEVGGIDMLMPSFRIELGCMCSNKKFQKLYPILMRSAGMINQDEFHAGQFIFYPGELLFSSFSFERIEDIVDPDTGETEINYKINYTFDISRNEDFVAGKYVIPKENAAGWSAKWSFFNGEEEAEYENASGEKIKVLRPKCVGCYADDVYSRTEYAKLIPSGIDI